MMDYTEITAKITPLEIGREVLIAELSLIGFESFIETEYGVQAYIQQSEFDKESLSYLTILNNPEFDVQIEVKQIESKNWNEEWEKNFQPIDVEGQCYIRAPFHNPKPGITFDIVIDPKMSFGTGHHETTFLMVKRLLEMNLKDKSVLDMGCGTGVLAILAKLKGAGYTEAIDIDEWAYNNTQENIRNNNCETIHVKLGGAELLGNDSFNVIVANINRNILLNDMNKYAENLHFEGDLLLSGFFSSDVEVLCLEASHHQLELIHQESLNDWTLLHFVKKGN